MHQLLNRLALHFLVNDTVDNIPLPDISSIDTLRSIFTNKHNNAYNIKNYNANKNKTKFKRIH